ncbi:MAG: amidohydrolase [Chloroflexi bacterium]|nr:amidohydrolase [Chloroflexota bacterium]
MLTIDTHYHAGEGWFEPVEVFIFLMNWNDVDRGVLCQHRGEFDNSYLLECVKRYPGRISAVGTVDVTQPNAPTVLEQWAKRGMSAVRFWAEERSPEKDPLAIWRKAAELQMPVSCPGMTRQYALDEFRRMLEEIPDLIMVLEHGAVLETFSLGGEKQNPKPPYTEFRKVMGLAQYPNVYIKVTGFGEMMRRPATMTHPPFDIRRAPPFIDMAIEAFGANRVMIGSDPTRSTREGYGNVWRLLREYLSTRPREDQEAIMGKTAASLFKFEPTA